MATVKEALVSAKSVLRERGHARGAYATADGKVCAMGALQIACGARIRPDSDGFVEWPDGFDHITWYEAADHITTVSQDVYGLHPARFNDDVAPDVKAVLDLFDQAIACA